MLRAFVFPLLIIHTSGWVPSGSHGEKSKYRMKSKSSSSPGYLAKHVQIDYYNVLGLKPGAERGEIRRAYARQARVLHPDLQNGTRQEYAECVDAYATLRDERKRRNYDRMRATDKTLKGVESAIDNIIVPFVRDVAVPLVHCGWRGIKRQWTLLDKELLPFGNQKNGDWKTRVAKAEAEKEMAQAGNEMLKARAEEIEIEAAKAKKMQQAYAEVLKQSDFSKTTRSKQSAPSKRVESSLADIKKMYVLSSTPLRTESRKAQIQAAKAKKLQEPVEAEVLKQSEGPKAARSKKSKKIKSVGMSLADIKKVELSLADALRMESRIFLQEMDDVKSRDTNAVK